MRAVSDCSHIINVQVSELQVSMQLSLYYAFHSEALKKHNCEVAERKWTSIKQIWERYRVRQSVLSCLYVLLIELSGPHLLYP